MTILPRFYTAAARYATGTDDARLSKLVKLAKMTTILRLVAERERGDRNAG